MKGVYVLIISVGKDTKVNVGAFGSVFFERGLYAYVGSAQNSLEKRIDRHLRKTKRKFWHIDYVLDDDAVRVVKVFYKEAEKSEECRIARKLSENGIAVKRFGCSDCGCVSHLFRVNDYGFLRDFMSEMRVCLFFTRGKSSYIVSKLGNWDMQFRGSQLIYLTILFIFCELTARL